MNDKNNIVHEIINQIENISVATEEEVVLMVEAPVQLRADPRLSVLGPCWVGLTCRRVCQGVPGGL